MVYFLQTPISINANLEKGLQSIYGIGESRAKLYVKIYGFLNDAKGRDLRRLHKLQLKASLENFPGVLGEDLKQIYLNNRQRLIDIKAYRGRRHKHAYPVRGQRSHTNAKTQKRLNTGWKPKTFGKNAKKKNLKQKLQKLQKLSKNKIIKKQKFKKKK